jgi:hypothetical protein
MSSVTSTQDSLKEVEVPDFYWKFQLDRLAAKLGKEIPFKAENYNNAKGYKDLYQAYYFDLTISGNTKGYNPFVEREISESDWDTIFTQSADYIEELSSKNRGNLKALPENDFDFLQQFYTINLNELESSFGKDEFGEQEFPYKNMKELYNAAMKGTLSIPGVTKPEFSSSKPETLTLDASDIIQSLDTLEGQALKDLDAAHERVLTFAKNPIPDDHAKQHYQKIRETLAKFPQSAAEMTKYRENFEKEVEEMARFAAREDEHHDAHHEEEGEEEGADHHHTPKMSVTEEFFQKYGYRLEELQDRYNQFKADPVNYLEKSIAAKFGTKGLEIWKKSQEFSTEYDVLSDAEKQSVEKSFQQFLKQI